MSVQQNLINSGVLRLDENGNTVGGLTEAQLQEFCSRLTHGQQIPEEDIKRFQDMVLAAANGMGDLKKSDCQTVAQYLCQSYPDLKNNMDDLAEALNMKHEDVMRGFAEAHQVYRDSLDEHTKLIYEQSCKKRDDVNANLQELCLKGLASNPNNQELLALKEGSVAYDSRDPSLLLAPEDIAQMQLEGPEDAPEESAVFSPAP